MSLAARHEEYDDFGTTTNPKFGVVWSPISTLKVRGSWGTSFRAASLPQVFDGPGASATFLNRANGARTLTLLLTGGNPDLRPETSETFTAGFDFQREDGLTLGLTYFDTSFEDRIALPVTENIAGVLFDPDLSPFVTLINPIANPSDLALIQGLAAEPWFPTAYPVNTYGAIVDARWLNTGAVRVRGIDFSARRAIEYLDQRFVLDASGSYIIDFDSQVTPTAANRSVVGLTGYPVSLRARTGMSWSRADWGASLHWSYIDGAQDRLGKRIASWRTVDGSVSWTAGQGALSGLRATLSIQNLLDEDPPFYDAPSGFGFDPGQANLLGRQVALQLTRRW